MAPQQVDSIHTALMQDPDFQAFPGKTKEESAWATAWSRVRQAQKNNVALSMGSELEKESSFSAMGPDTGESKVSPKQGVKTELDDANKPGLRILESHKDVSGPHKEYPTTAAESVGRTHVLKKDDDENELEDALEDADEEFMGDTEDALDDIVQALRDLRAKLHRHEEAEMVEDIEPEGSLEILGIAKHYTGAKHGHLETGQWVRPGMQTVPGKTWGGKRLAKLLFTTKRGKVESSSVPQHRLLHGRKLPHTHIEGGQYKRESFNKGAIPNVSGTPPRPGLSKNPLSRRWVNRAVGIRQPKETEIMKEKPSKTDWSWIKHPGQVKGGQAPRKSNVMKASFYEHPADKLIRQLNRTKNPEIKTKLERTLQEKHGVGPFGNPNLPPKTSALNKLLEYTGLEKRKRPFGAIRSGLKALREALKSPEPTLAQKEHEKIARQFGYRKAIINKK